MNSTASRTEPSSKQLSFLNGLLKEADELLARRESITGCAWPEATEAVRRMRDTGGRTRREISSMIESAMSNNRQLRSELNGLGVETARPERPAYVTEVGMYRVGERIFKVLPARHSDRHYAKELTDFHWEDGQPVAEHEGTLRFVYAPGAMAVIKAEHRMTPEQERAFGKLIGHCVDCGKLLTKPESVDYGKGPVCSDNYTK